jgi:hypothetical protein
MRLQKCRTETFRTSFRNSAGDQSVEVVMKLHGNVEVALSRGRGSRPWGWASGVGCTAKVVACMCSTQALEACLRVLSIFLAVSAGATVVGGMGVRWLRWILFQLMTATQMSSRTGESTASLLATSVKTSWRA